MPMPVPGRFPFRMARRPNRRISTTTDGGMHARSSLTAANDRDVCARAGVQQFRGSQDIFEFFLKRGEPGSLSALAQETERSQNQVR